MSASAISVVSHTRASLPAAVSAVCGQGVGGHGDRIPAVQPVVGAVPVYGAATRRSAVAQRRDGDRSTGSGMRHTSVRCWVQGRSVQSWANMPPRALTGGN